MLVVVRVACGGEAVVVKEVPSPRTQVAALFNSAAVRVAVAMSLLTDEAKHKPKSNQPLPYHQTTAGEVPLTNLGLFHERRHQCSRKV